MILIVDDKRENVSSLKRLLEINKFQVDTAYSGEEALKKILQNSYTLIILDVQMGGMDGFAVAELILGQSQSEELLIIFISPVNIEKHFISKGFALGGIDYITRPFDPDIILLKVKTFYRLSEQARNLKSTHAALQKENIIRQKAEAELNNRISELRSFIEAIPHIAFTIREDGSIEFVNQRWFLYASYPEVFPETHELDPTIKTCLKIASLQNEPYSAELRIKKLYGNEFRYHLLMVSPVKIGQTIIKWAGTLTDIQEQKSVTVLLEERVKERTIELENINSQLEGSNEHLQHFASVASHDLKEPLRKIETFSGIIKENYLNGDSPGLLYIDRIISSSRRMTQLINNLLTYSSLSPAESLESVTISSVVADVLLDLEHVIEEKKAVVVVDCPHTIEIIPSQMRQVFQNMLSNALKFSKKDVAPVISVTSELVNDTSTSGFSSSAGDFCRVMIVDNGIGFNEEYRERIFEVFERLHSKSQYEGNGIGLAIVRKIINKHQGSISAQSKVNEGASFTIILPVKQATYALTSVMSNTK